MRLFLILQFFSFSLIFSEPLKAGDELKLIQYQTQFGDEVTVPESTSRLIFASEMEASKIAHSVLENAGADYLKNRSAVLVSDIHRMPYFITKFVALPKLKSYSYTIHLIREEGPGEIFPREKGKLTLISLKKFKILSIKFISSSDELKEELEKK